MATSQFPHDLPLPGPKNDLKPTPGKTPAPTRTVFSTYKKNVKLGPGQTLGFTKGKGYYAKPTPTPPPANTSPHVSLTPLQEANLQVQRMLAPQYTQAASDATAQNAAIKNFSLELIKQLQGVPSQVQGDFNQAIGQQTNLVNAASDALRNANPNQQDQQLLQAIGAPQSQQDALTNQNANAFNGGAAVGLYRGGVLPMDALEAQKQAAVTLARLQPGIEGLRAQQALAGALLQQKQAREKIAEQAPALVQNWLNAFNSNKFKAQQIALEQQAYGLKSQGQAFNQNATTTRLSLEQRRLANQQNQFVANYTRQVKEFNAKQTTAQNKLKLPSASLSRANGYLTAADGSPILDPNGKRQILPGFQLQSDGSIAKVSTKGNPTFPNLTSSQVQHLRAGIAAAFNGVPERKDPNTGKILQVKLPPVSYFQAINEAVSEGYSRAAATRMANRFYMPGQRGRPAKPKPDTGFRSANLNG